MTKCCKQQVTWRNQYPDICTPKQCLCHTHTVKIHSFLSLREQFDLPLQQWTTGAAGASQHRANPHPHWETAPFVPHSLTCYLHWSKANRGQVFFLEDAVSHRVLLKLLIRLGRLCGRSPSTDHRLSSLDGGRTAAVIREALLDKLISH